jgi:drug/metabolite transporter (DMT)-like permease
MDLLIKALGASFTSWQIAFYRTFGGMTALLFLFGRRGNPFRGSRVGLLMLRGAVGTATFLAFVAAVRLLPLSTAMVLFYAYPAFAAVFAALLLGERVSRAGVACLGAVLVGIAVVVDFRGGGSALGQVAGVVAGVLSGLVVVLIRELRKVNGPVVIYLYFCTAGTLVTAPAFFANPRLPASPAECLLVLGLVLTSMTAQLLMNQGFLHCRGWEGGLILTTEVVFAALAGIVFLGDPVTWRFAVGSLLIVGSVVAMHVTGRPEGRNGPRGRAPSP